MVQQVSEETLLMPLKKDQLHYTVGPKDNNFYCFFLKTKKKYLIICILYQFIF